MGLLFPGQGSHKPGMDAPYRDGALLARGLELLGEDPFERLADGTRYQQPAVFLCSVCAWDAAGRPAARAAAGHSLGEFASLVAAGALGFEDGLRLVALRGELMAEAGRRAGPGGMVAMLGGDEGRVRALAAELELVVANDNAPGQLVLSGPAQRLDEASRRAAEEGIRVRALDVSAAFHSPAMRAGVEPLREALTKVEFRAPAYPVFSCGTAKPFAVPADELADNVTRPVRWRQTMLALRAAGVERFTELGPGAVLTGLARRIFPQGRAARAVA